MPLNQYKYSNCKALNTLIIPKPKFGFQLASLKFIINDTSEGMYIEQALTSKGLECLTLLKKTKKTKTKLYWKRRLYS